MVSVRKRGKVFEYRFEVATVEGTRKWISKSGYPSKAEAFKEGAKAYNDFYYNGNKVQLREKMSYADFLDYWIDTYASFNLHYSTTISYINIIKNHVKPRIGYYQLWQLDTRLLQEFINKIYVEYAFSKNYMASILKVVKGSLKYACYTLNYINTNPAEHVHAPRIDKINNDPAHIFTQEEIERILERFKGTHSIYYSFLTAYYTGMRVSEVYGLTWDCIDFENKTLTINKNIIKKNQYGLPKRKNITKGHSVGVWYYGDCKNPQSKRTISIGDTLVNALKNFKKEQEIFAEHYGDSYMKHYKKEVKNPYTKKNEIKIKNDYGNCEITDLENATLNIDCDAGNVEIGKVKNATIKCDYGNVEAKEILNKCDIKANCGNISIDRISIQEDSSIKADLGNIDINNTNDIYIEANVDLGKTNIANSNRNSNVTLKVKCDCGNVTIK